MVHARAADVRHRLRLARAAGRPRSAPRRRRRGRERALGVLAGARARAAVRGDRAQPSARIGRRAGARAASAGPAGARRARRSPLAAPARSSALAASRHVVAQRRLRADPPGRARHARRGRASVAAIPSGRPSFTPERAEEYARVLTVREQRVAGRVAPSNQKRDRARRRAAEGASAEPCKCDPVTLADPSELMLSSAPRPPTPKAPAGPGLLPRPRSPTSPGDPPRRHQRHRDSDRDADGDRDAHRDAHAGGGRRSYA